MDQRIMINNAKKPGVAFPNDPHEKVTKSIEVTRGSFENISEMPMYSFENTWIDLIHYWSQNTIPWCQF